MATLAASAQYINNILQALTISFTYPFKYIFKLLCAGLKGRGDRPALSMTEPVSSTSQVQHSKMFIFNNVSRCRFLVPQIDKVMHSCASYRVCVLCSANLSPKLSKLLKYYKVHLVHIASTSAVANYFGFIYYCSYFLIKFPSQSKQLAKANISKDLYKHFHHLVQPKMQ